MSGHRRVKDIDYDAGDVAGYGEEEGYGDEYEGISPEDKEQLRQGTVVVRGLLDEDVGAAATDREIQDALWYYYYDVDKSAAYITKQRKPPEPTQKKKKRLSKFDEAAAKAAGSGGASNGVQPAREGLTSTHRPGNSFFVDTPWLRVPPSRLGTILVIPLHPRGGLLGGASPSGAPGSGSGKPSKLAALAASRKKAQEEKKKSEASTRAPEPSEDGAQDRKTQPPKTSSAALLDRLSRTKREQSAKDEPGVDSVREDTAPVAPSDRPSKRTYPAQEKPPQEPEPPPEPSPSEPVEDEQPPEKPKYNAEQLTASPSPFAQALFPSESETRTTESTELFSLPYPRHPTRKADATDPFLGPSPDDIVAKAQTKGAKASNATSKPQKTTANEEAKSTAEGVAAMKLEDAPQAKRRSKNIDVLAEYEKTKSKNTANFVVIGHVDHGKSTLMGRLLYDLKVVTRQSFEKLQREATQTGKSSFALAWVMDSTAEERKRGVTVDIATNTFETDRTRFTILDAPGHKDFIPNMIAGASQADFAVLVIDASTNAFEAGLRGQTKEHALLVRSMGIARLIVAINKMDMTGWSKDRFDEISQQMSAFLTSAGFQAKNVAIVPCSGLTGENVVTKLPEGVAPWYTGGTFVEELDASEPTARALTDPLRLTVSDVFRGGVQHALSIAGRLDAGSLQAGEVVLAMPDGEKATIKAVEVDGEPHNWAVAGQIATLHLSDIDPVHLRLGDIICSPSSPIRNTRSFTAKILAFEHVMPAAVDVHRGRLHTPARISQLVALLGKSGGEVQKKKPRVVKPGSVARVRVELDKGLPLEASARVVFRVEGSTLAAGLVEEVDVA